MTDARPLPVADDVSKGFWQAAARHELTMAKCGQCGTFAYPPGAICCACGSTAPEFAFVAVSGKGRLRSWTTVRQALLPGFAELVPYVTVDVELAEQAELRIIGRLIDGIDAPLALDAKVEVCWEDVAPDLAVPAFRLTSA